MPGEGPGELGGILGFGLGFDEVMVIGLENIKASGLVAAVLDLSSYPFSYFALRTPGGTLRAWASFFGTVIDSRSFICACGE